jgi:RNA polymerase primary sigma factor
MYENDPVVIYLHEVANVRPLTREEEAECVRHIRARDDHADEAEKDLAERALSLVVEIVRQHPSDRVHILDMIQTGDYALITALRVFPDSGAENFRAFAHPFIENAIVHAVTTADC